MRRINIAVCSVYSLLIFNWRRLIEQQTRFGVVRTNEQLRPTSASSLDDVPEVNSESYRDCVEPRKFYYNRSTSN